VRVIQHREELGLDSKVDRSLEKSGFVRTRFLRQLLDRVSGLAVPKTTSLDESPRVDLVFITRLLLVIITRARRVEVYRLDLMDNTKPTPSKDTAEDQFFYWGAMYNK